MSKGHDDYAVEPIRGLPENLPSGEHILWQGAPSFWEIAKHVFYFRVAAAYLVALMAWRVSDAYGQSGFGDALLIGASLWPIAMIGLGMLALLAWLVARTSVYTITNRRIVMRVGIALPMAINIPFVSIGSADLRRRSNGTGDITLSLTSKDRVAYSNFWPHVRPWRLTRPEPMLRGLPDVQQTAELLSRALAEALPAECVMTSHVRPENPKVAKYPFGKASRASERELAAAAGQVA